MQSKMTDQKAAKSSHLITSGSRHEPVVPILEHNGFYLVDARMLHQKLEVGKDFSTWIRDRIKEYDFISGNDFFPVFGEYSKMGGRPRKEYHLTLGMAKELAMVERNEIGRRVRRYFIQMEERTKVHVTPLPTPKEAFQGIVFKKINDRPMLPYTEVKRACGYSPRSSSSSHKARYWMHFVKEGEVLYITQEFAEHLYHQRKVFANRSLLRNMQPVIPIGFGDNSQLELGYEEEDSQKGGNHA